MGSPTALLATVPRNGELDATFGRWPCLGVPAMDGDDGLNKGTRVGTAGATFPPDVSCITASASDEGNGRGEDIVLGRKAVLLN